MNPTGAVLQRPPNNLASRRRSDPIFVAKPERFPDLPTVIRISLLLHDPLLYYPPVCMHELDLFATFDNYKISRSSEPIGKRAA